MMMMFMIDELREMWEELIVTYFKVGLLSWYLEGLRRKHRVLRKMFGSVNERNVWRIRSN
jgi:hypothetical protein